MIKRYLYKPDIKNLVTVKNETIVSIDMTGNIRRCPDMYTAYQKFSKFFQLPLNRFILTNGCETAVKEALLAVKPKSLFYARPGWLLLEVLCEACGVESVTEQIQSNNDGYFFSTCTKTADWYYTVLGRGSLCTYVDELDFNGKDKKLIIDTTYFNLDELKTIIKYHPNDVICGSFDKLYGNGLRLGFCIYPEQYDDAFQLQREQYINTLAVDFLKQDYLTKVHICDINLSMFKTLPNFVCSTRNYMTFKGNLKTKTIGKVFKIDDQEYTRYGIPEHFDDMLTLLKEIKNA